MALAQHIVLLLGGVGGAKLARGLLHTVAPESLCCAVNTGDDFWHLGLKICPDLDTVMYTLSDIVNPATGWGVAQDSRNTLDSLARFYGKDSWFQLGDKDLATHLLRTQRLRQGHSLSAISDELRQRLGIRARLLPMCDEEVPTIVDTVEQGQLAFQEYFVKQRWQPTLRQLHYKNASETPPSPGLLDALEAADLVLLAPSNPWLSLGPILALRGMRTHLRRLRAPVVAVSPVIAGAAVKGPTAKIMRELGLPVEPAAVVRFYGDILDGFVNDLRNDPLSLPGIRSIELDTLMHDERAKQRLAREIINWVGEWSS